MLSRPSLSNRGVLLLPSSALLTAAEYKLQRVVWTNAQCHPRPVIRIYPSIPVILSRINSCEPLINQDTLEVSDKSCYLVLSRITNRFLSLHVDMLGSRWEFWKKGESQLDGLFFLRYQYILLLLTEFHSEYITRLFDCVIFLD